MATRSESLTRIPWRRSKYLLFAFIGVMMVYVVQHNERF